LPKLKVCSKCKRSLPSDKIHFYARSDVKDGLVSACKECMGAKCFQKPIAREGYKFCSKCKRELPANEYHFHFNSYTNRLVAACKECAGYNFTQPKKIVKEGHKICSKCGIEKPLTNEYFGERTSGSIDGFKGVCRVCERSRVNNWVSNNLERNRASKKAWKYADPNRKEKWDIYYEKNRDKILLRSKRWDIEHEGVSIIRSCKWFENNKDRARKNSIAWRKENPEKRRLSGQRRRTLKKNAKATLTNEQWDITLNHFGRKCAYCGRSAKDGETLHQDHFHPLAKNGELSVENVIPACGSCNSSKGKKLFSVWYPKFKYYSKEREKTILEYLNYHNGFQQLALI